MCEKLDAVELHTVLDTLPCAVFIKDENLHFIYVNRAYEVLFDVKAKDVLSRTVLDLSYLPEEGPFIRRKPRRWWPAGERAITSSSISCPTAKRIRVSTGAADLFRRADCGAYWASLSTSRNKAG